MCAMEVVGLLGGMDIHYCLGAPLARAVAKVQRAPELCFCNQTWPKPAIRQTFTRMLCGFERLALLLQRDH
jgi:hypothetical protein